MSTTSRFVVDSWAWVEYLDGTPKGARIRDVIEEDAELFTHAVTLAEVVSKAKRRGKDPMAASERISSLSRFEAPSLADSTEAGIVHAETKEKRTNFSLADAFVLQSARRLKARVLTGDPHFRGLREARLVD
jgi:predicted nucleic acid-binding protein